MIKNRFFKRVISMVITVALLGIEIGTTEVFAATSVNEGGEAVMSEMTDSEEVADNSISIENGNNEYSESEVTEPLIIEMEDDITASTNDYDSDDAEKGFFQEEKISEPDFSEEEIVIQEDNDEVNYDGNNVDMEESDLMEGQASGNKPVKFTVKMPEDGYFDDDAYYQLIIGYNYKYTSDGQDNTNNSTVCVPGYMNKGQREYNIEYNGYFYYEPEQIDYVALYIYNTYEGNMYCGSSDYLYITDDFAWSRNKEEAKQFTVDELNSNMVITLPKSAVTGKATIPESGYVKEGSVSGSICGEYKLNGSTYTTSRTLSFSEMLSETKNSVNYAFPIIEGDEIEFTSLYYYIYSDSSVATNLISGTTMYYDAEAETIVRTKPNGTLFTKESGDTVEKNFDFLAKNAFVKLMLSDDVFINGNSSYSVYVYLYDENGSYETKSVSFSNTNREQMLFLGDLQGNRISKIKVIIYQNSSLESNIITGTYLYFDGTKWGYQEHELTEPVEFGAYDNPTTFTITPAKNILNFRVKMPENARHFGSDLKGKVYAKYGTKSLSESICMKPDESYADVKMAFPDDVTDLKQIYVKFDSNDDLNGNINMQTQYYNDGCFVIASSQAQSDISFTNCELSAELLITNSVKGVITIPNEAFISDSKVRFRIRCNNNSSLDRFVYASKGMDKLNFEIPFYGNYSTSNLTRLTWIMDSKDNYTVTNIPYSKTYYLDVNGNLTTEQQTLNDTFPDASPCSITKDFTIPCDDSVKYIMGKIKLGENTKISGGIASIYIGTTLQYRDVDSIDETTGETTYCYSTQNTTVSSEITQEDIEKGEITYRIPLKNGLDYTEVQKMNFKLNKSNQNMFCNIRLSSSYKYMTEDGSLNGTSNTELHINIAGENADIPDVELGVLKSITIKGSLNSKAFIEGADCYLTLYGYGTGINSNSGKITLKGEDKEFSYTIYESENCAGSPTFNYGSLYIGTSNGTVTSTNLPVYKTIYFDVEGNLYNGTSEIQGKEITDLETTINVVVPINKVLSGKISLPKGADLGGNTITGTISAYSDSSVKCDFSLSNSSRTAQYSLSVPEAVINPMLKVTVNNASSFIETNVSVASTMYVSEDGTITDIYSNAHNIILEDDENTLDIAFGLRRSISGTIKVPDGAKISNDISARISAIIGDETISQSFIIKKDTGENVCDVNNIEYHLELSADTKKVDAICINLSGDAYSTSNLLTGSTYYMLDENGEATLTASPDNADCIEITDENLNIGLDITLLKALMFTGNITLADGDYFRGGSISGYIKALVDGVIYQDYFDILEYQSSAPFRMQLPHGTERIDYIQLQIYPNEILDTTLLLGTDVYLTKNGWTGNVSAASEVDVQGDELVLELHLPKAKTLSGKIIAVDDVDSILEGKIYVICNEKQYIKSFEIESGKSTEYKIIIPPEDEQQCIVFYELADNVPENYISGKVYIAENGFSLMDSNAKKFNMDYGLNICDINLATWEEIKEDGVLLESLHPYLPSEDYSVTYTYPGECDALKVHFSEYTKVENSFDEIIIYDSSDKCIGTYTGTELSDKTVEIQDCGFKVVLSSDNNKNNYGFVIDRIDAENGVLSSPVAVSVSNVNYNPDKIVIHNSVGKNKTFYSTVASYDKLGKALELKTQRIVMNEGIGVVNMDMDVNPDACSGKLMLYDESFSPISSCQFTQVPKYKVNYIFNDKVETVRVKLYGHGQLLEESSFIPAVEGLKFKGWYEDAECKTPFEFGNPVYNDINIYAGWDAAAKLFVEKEGEGNVTTQADSTEYLKEGDTAVINAEPIEGWEFDEWKTEGLDETQKTIADNKITIRMPEGDARVTAVFKRHVTIEWLETSAQYRDENGDTHMALFEDDRLYLEDAETSVSLTGKLDCIEEISKISYTYTYRDRSGEAISGDEEDEIATTNEVKTLSDVILPDEEGKFKLNDLPTNIGNNRLTILVTKNDNTYSYEYVIVEPNNNAIISDTVEMMDMSDMTDMLKVQDFNSGIEAFWMYDNGTPDDSSDDVRVLIIDKQSEIAQRAMLSDEDEDAITVGCTWVIPACDQFPLGMSFVVKDIGDAEFAPSAPEDSPYYQVKFSSDEYIFMLAGDPDMNEILSEAFSAEFDGVDGIEFAILPDNAVLSCSIDDPENGDIIAAAEVGEMYEAASIKGKGFQEQNLISAIIPKVNVSGKNASLKLKFGDTVIYDEDGNKNTENDRVTISGDIGIENLKFEGEVDWDWEILPTQVGLVAEYNEVRNFKVEIGGTASDIKGGDIGDKNKADNDVKMRNVVNSFKKKFGSSSNENAWKHLTLSGVDMDDSIVLAAVGIDLATKKPRTGYKDVVAFSKRAGFDPMVVLMFVWDLDGSIKGVLGYSYEYSCYHAKGFNLLKGNAKGSNNKIRSFKKASTEKFGKYKLERIDIDQTSQTNSAKPHGTHTVYTQGEANIETGLGVGLGFMMCGVNFAQIKGGAYASANAKAYGSVSYNKGRSPAWDAAVAGMAGFEAGLFAEFEFAMKLNYKRNGLIFDADEDVLDISCGSGKKKWRLLGNDWTTLGITGTVTMPGKFSNKNGYDNEEPLEGVEVSLTKKKEFTWGGLLSGDDETYWPDSQTKKVTTNEKGKYSFKSIPEGTYELTFHKDGYNDIKREASVSAKNVSAVKGIFGAEVNVTMGTNNHCEVVGTVLDYDDKPINTQAIITLVSENNNGDHKTGYFVTEANNNGEFKLGKKGDKNKGITPGKYTLRVQARGYKDVSMTVCIPSVDETITLDDINMVKGIYGNCTIIGQVLDYATGITTGAPLTLYLRKGLNSRTGEVVDAVKLASDGKYQFKVPAGNYTITVMDKRKNIATSERYVENTANITVQANKTFTKNIYVSQSNNNDQIRIILTWGATPRDLDSHLVGPTADGSGKFHTYYSKKTYTYNGKKYADLDLDDISSYGPETTTIYRKNSRGSYSFYVHDFSTGKGATSTVMANSGAKVEVYKGTDLVNTFRVNKSSAGTLWHVFDFDAGSGRITKVDTYTGDSYYDKLGTYDIQGAFDDAILTEEEEDINLIFSELTDKELEMK